MRWGNAEIMERNMAASGNCTRIDNIEEEYRERKIWGGSEFRDRGDFVIQRIRTKVTSINKYLSIDEEQCRLAKEMHMAKQLILGIRRKWGSDPIQIVANEIREGKTHGDERISRRNKRTQANETTTRRGKIVLKDTNGDIPIETH